MLNVQKESMKNSRQSGFTLIELLVVGVIVVILASLVAMTYSGVQAKNRNRDRAVSIDELKSQLENYYAQHTKYPVLAELNDPAWRATNFKDMPVGTVRDPQWNDKVTACTAKGLPMLSGAPIAKCYSYQATAADGAPCLDPAAGCAQYSLTAIFEGGEKYVKTSLN
jgi:prepilin-type N-terminal cleavage/methylation domain-containing protein